MKTIKMKRADWEKWDEALRSGRYAQTAENLYHDGSYCCLGVLQHSLTGHVEDNADELPSRGWLQRHGISFDSANTDVARHVRGRTPYLPVLNGVASSANDFIDDYSGDHMFDFTAIADAIQDCVEFTDA